jgi:hypothetical protein
VALSDAEVFRLKYETGVNILLAGAEPYVGEVIAVFNQVVQRFLNSEASTTSSTTVAATPQGTAATAAGLTVVSATGLTPGLRIAIDVDAFYEETIVQSVTGLVVTAPLKLAHSGTYPVTSDGGEMIVRRILREIGFVHDAISEARDSAGVKQIDKGDVILHGRSNREGGGTRLSELQDLLGYWRDELCSALGVTNWRRKRRTSGGGISLG